MPKRPRDQVKSEEGPGKVKQRLRYWALRWTVPDSSSEHVDKMRSVFANYFDRFIFQQECTVHPETRKENWHLQGAAKSNQQLWKHRLVEQLVSQGLKGIEVQPAVSHGMKALDSYCMKRDNTYRAGPWTPEGLKEMVEPYTGQDLEMVRQTPLPWQMDLTRVLMSNPDDRKIFWIYDPVGCQGKTKFAKLCCLEHKAVLLRWCKYADAAHLVRNAKSRKIVLFDLTRAKPREVSACDMYATIEAVKDGMLNSTKYETDTLFFSPPHVVVFSNSLPNTDSLSKDRWVVLTIGTRGLVYPSPVQVPPATFQFFRVDPPLIDKVESLTSWSDYYSE